MLRVQCEANDAPTPVCGARERPPLLSRGWVPQKRDRASALRPDEDGLDGSATRPLPSDKETKDIEALFS